MFYRSIIVSCLLGLLTSPCFSSPALRLVRDLNFRLVEARLPYLKKVAQGMLNTEQLKKLEALTSVSGKEHVSIDVYREMEAIKMLGNKEVSDLNTFAAKFFAAVKKNEGNDDFVASPFFRLVDNYKHLLAQEHIEKIDTLAAEMKKISSKDIFLDFPTDKEMADYEEMEFEYIQQVFAALKDAGAVDLNGISAANTERIGELLLSKAGIDSSDRDLYQINITPYVIEQLRIQLKIDLSLHGDSFRVNAQTEYGFTPQEVESLRQTLNLQNKSEHYIFDYFADIITREKFVDKMEELLVAHGEGISDAGKQEISKQLADLR